MRPPMLAGPIDRHLNVFRTGSSDWLMGGGGGGACGGWPAWGAAAGAWAAGAWAWMLLGGQNGQAAHEPEQNKGAQCSRHRGSIPPGE